MAATGSHGCLETFSPSTVRGQSGNTPGGAGHRPLGDDLGDGLRVPEDHETMARADLQGNAVPPELQLIPVVVGDARGVVEVSPPGLLAGDIAQGRVPVDPVGQAVLDRLVDVDHQEPDAGRQQPQQPAGGQVLQALLQGRPVLGELPSPPQRSLVPVRVRGVVDEEEVGALLVQVGHR